MNKLTTGIMTLIAAGTFAVTPLQATGADGVRIEHLGVNNTLVRVDGNEKFILLPVQESTDDARINVVVDGRVAETIKDRLHGPLRSHSL